MDMFSISPKESMKKGQVLSYFDENWTLFYLFTPQVYIKKSLFLRNAYIKMYVQFQWRNISTTYM